MFDGIIGFTAISGLFIPHLCGNMGRCRQLYSTEGLIQNWVPCFVAYIDIEFYNYKYLLSFVTLAFFDPYGCPN